MRSPLAQLSRLETIHQCRCVRSGIRRAVKSSTGMGLLNK